MAPSAALVWVTGALSELSLCCIPLGHDTGAPDAVTTVPIFLRLITTNSAFSLESVGRYTTPTPEYEELWPVSFPATAARRSARLVCNVQVVACTCGLNLLAKLLIRRDVVIHTCPRILGTVAFFT
jgi:hypothetical protein